MEWNNNNNNNKNNGSSFSSFVSPPPPTDQSSSSALFFNNNYSNYNYNYNYNYNLDHFPPVLERKKAVVEGDDIDNHQEMKSVVGGGGGSGLMDHIQNKTKKKLSNEQLESLERSFQEEVKLDPDRKMKLSKELGLQPRQIAVWFQNRRARWKAKQLEHLYDSLKQQFDTVSREKHNLQLEVMKLRSMLRDQQAAVRNQGSMAYTDVSGEETTTVESTSVGVRSCNDYYIYNNYNVEDFNQISAASAPPFWWGAEAAHLPSNYPN